MTMSPSTHDEVRLVVGGTSYEFVLVPAGTFLRGTNAERRRTLTAEMSNAVLDALSERPTEVAA